MNLLYSSKIKSKLKNLSLMFISKPYLRYPFSKPYFFPNQREIHVFFAISTLHSIRISGHVLWKFIVCE